MKSRLIDWVMERAVALCGAAVGLLIAGIFFYLATESRYAFQQKYTYGYRFAALHPSAPLEELGMDPNASLLAAHIDGLDELDDKDSAVRAPTIFDLEGVAPAATATGLEKAPGRPSDLYRDDWRAPKAAGSSDTYVLYAFATAELKGDTMRLGWEPDASFLPEYTPFRVRLQLLRAPEGIEAPKVDIDLRETPKGFVDLPKFVATTDEERTHGYVFQVVAEPTQSNSVLATFAGFFKSEWAPTSQYPRYGFLPLLLASLLITTIAIVIATIPSLAAAVYLSEIAPTRVREWLKPIIELLASVPTVVLGYFGLMILAPGLMKTFGEALHMESGRSLLTAAIMMAVLIMPTIVSVAEDALRNLPQSLRDGAAGLGLTTAEALRKVLVPSARAGLVAAVLLGFARATGETMIVWILSGGTPTMPRLSPASLVESSRGIADTIGIEMANVEFEKPHYGHLFLIGLTLFALTVAINALGQSYAKRHAWRA